MSNSQLKKIDQLNIGLIIISLAVAIMIPFRLFLFSYAILGPLHYLTEINWLDRKNYFMKPRRTWIAAFVLFAFLVSLYPLIEILPFEFNFNFTYSLWNIYSYTGPILLSGFLFAISLVFFKRPLNLVIAFVASFGFTYLLLEVIPFTTILVGFFLPTLIHVYLFTLLFMIYGTLKSGSTPGIIAAALLLLAPAVLLLIRMPSESYVVSEAAKQALLSSELIEINKKVSALMGGWGDAGFDAFSGRGIKIQMFIAFAYTYHYLNWFSKTSIIGWRNALTKKNTMIIVLIWALVLMLYAYDFKTGFVALLFMSFLHVLMEFPLNVVTIREIFRFGRRQT